MYAIGLPSHRSESRMARSIRFAQALRVSDCISSGSTLSTSYTSVVNAVWCGLAAAGSPPVVTGMPISSAPRSQEYRQLSRCQRARTNACIPRTQPARALRTGGQSIAAPIPLSQ